MLKWALFYYKACNIATFLKLKTVFSYGILARNMKLMNISCFRGLHKMMRLAKSGPLTDKNAT